MSRTGQAFKISNRVHHPDSQETNLLDRLQNCRKIHVGVTSIINISGASDWDEWSMTCKVRKLFERSCRAKQRKRGCVLLETTVSLLLKKVLVSGCDLGFIVRLMLKRKTSLSWTDEVKLAYWTNVANFNICAPPHPTSATIHGRYSRPRYSCNLQVSPAIVSIFFLRITVHRTSHTWCSSFSPHWIKRSKPKIRRTLHL